MKRNFLLFHLLLISHFIFSQTAKIPTTGSQNITTCYHTVYDMGGASDGISANADGSITFYPATAGNVIAIYVESLDIDWYNDYLYIYNGTSTSSPLIKTFQGTWGISNNIDHREYYGNNGSGAVTIRLKTWKYASSSDAGCIIRVRCAPISQPHNMIGNRQRIISSCNTTIYDHGGLYGDYSASSIDSIIILPDAPDKRVQISFQHFALNNYNGFDHLIFPGGLKTSPTNTLYQNSGYGLPAGGATVSSGNSDGSVHMIMTTDEKTQAQGFRAKITCVDATVPTPKETIVPSTGSASIKTCQTTVYDNGHKYNYAANSNGSLTINPAITGKKVQLNFSLFNTLASDALTVYDGTNTSAGILGTYSGAELPSAITASSANSSGALTVRFVSNGSDENAGFIFSTSCVDQLPETLLPTTGSETSTSCSNPIYDAGGPAGKYSNNSNGTLLLTPSSGKMMKLTFNSFSTQEANDVLTVYDGSDINAPILGKFSGNAIPSPLVATNASGKLFLQFVTDASVIGDGFAIATNCVDPQFLIPETGISTITTCLGTLFDNGGLTGNYSNSADGYLIITPGESGKLSKVTFASFSLTASDTLYIYNGADTNSLLAKYSGNTLPTSVSAPISSETGILMLRLKTDDKESSSGFIAQISCQDKIAMVPAKGNSSLTVCEHTIYDSGGPTNNYSNNQDGSVTIYPEDVTKSIRATFLSMNTESGYDFVYIYDGVNTSAPQLGKFSGTTIPTALTANNASGALTIRFTSDGSSVYSGFVISLNCAQRPITIPATGSKSVTTCSGIVYDSGGSEGDYTNNNNGTLTVNPAISGARVKANFISLNTERFDYLYVYDGVISDSKLLATYNSNYYNPSNIPTIVASAENISGALVFKFTSDYTSTRAGFAIDISCEVSEVPVQSVTISPSNTLIEVGANTQLTAVILPDNVTDKSLAWSTSNSSIATVNQNGLVIGVAIGTVTITATADNGTIIGVAEVTVNPITSLFSVSKSTEPKIYPNPASDKIRIVHNSDKLSVRIFDGLGILQWSGHADKNGEVDIGNLSGGMYTVEMEGNNNSGWKKLSVSK
jgi:uncharacterized protein YjdB